MKSQTVDLAVAPILQATEQGLSAQTDALARARAFALPLIASEHLDTGENILAHADAVAEVLRSLGGSEAMQAASYLVYACDHLNKPEEVIAKAFGESYAKLAVETTRLVGVQRQARQSAGLEVQQQTENVRKMLLAFSRDLRVVMLRLASRLQTLRYFAATKKPVPATLSSESLNVFAPLANRLGIWQLKWEIEDLAFRFLEPDVYKSIATKLEDRRVEREAYVEQLRLQLQEDLRAQGVQASVQGRPKHIYSIVKKMRGKSLDFEHVYDVRALRVIVPDVRDCYAALGWVHAQFEPITEEFDDYIAKPKVNGYQSLHTVVRDDSVQGKGRTIEIQIRTPAMHQHAEHGVAAHWAYKEAGAKGYAGVAASGAYDAKIAVLRQLLAWERDLSTSANQALFDDRIYVLTPDAAIVELPQGATPIDFAYTVHTTLGHRCRGARVDGAMVTLNTALQNGQTVEITAAKEGGPSRDWLNTELGFLVSHRARAKVRAWFNAQQAEGTIARGREAVEKLLQREGKTAMKHDELAAQLGFKSADALFEVVGKDELSLKTIEGLLRPAPAALADDDFVPLKKARGGDGGSKGGVLVVGVDSLLTQLAKCCKPAPPDAIRGFVTRGKGVSIHRADCVNFKQMALRSEGRVIEVAWGQTKGQDKAVYAVDVFIQAHDRQGLLRDISEVFTKEKMNVIGVQTQSVKDTAWMTFTVEISDSAKLAHVLGVVAGVNGVRSAKRR
jgi:GTP pyrophosphokinase